MAFSKNNADERKKWIESGKLDDTVDHSIKNLTYSDFINKELLQYSVAANARAIPSVIDGLKPGQRKIIYSCFKRALKTEIKVAQLSGYVAEHSAYHHGETSLAMTIVNLAQNYIGSNNINLLEPLGQFGTRHQGGKDYASPRYIYTKLSPLARALYPEPDDLLLNILEDDGMKIEPEYYVPILPTVLINGTTGIGMGWSTSVPCYNPLDLLKNIRNLLDDKPLEDKLVPWYYGFKGTVELDESSNACSVIGKHKITGQNSVEITELPIGQWIGDYKEYLESFMEGDKDSQLLSELREFHTLGNIHFSLTFKQDKLDEIRDNIDKKLKLASSISLKNMVLFDSNGMIKRYDNAKDIIREFYDVRLKLYADRREHIIKILRSELNVLENKVRFINEILAETLDIKDKKKSELDTLLLERGYMSMKIESGIQHKEDMDLE